VRSDALVERLTRPAAFLAVVALAALLPSMGVTQVWEGILLQIVINACGALGMTLLFGFAGQLSIAQAAFAGAGAYSMGIMSVKTGLSPWLGLPVGIAVAMILAAVIGYPVLRLHGLYLAIATMALNIGAIVVVIEEKELTGGAIGLLGVEPLDFFGHELFDAKDLYYLALASFVVLFLLAHRLTRSPVGTMLAALRHDERAAALSGIHISLLKTKVFVLSAAFAAVSGFWLAAYLHYVPHESFSLVPSLLFLIMVVIGGLRSLTGAALGAAFITILPQIVPDRPREQQFIFALAFLLVTVFAPRGLVGIAQDLWRIGRGLLSGRRGGPAAEAQADA
jgi:branched-chain amino acid transport system permease protein